MKCHHCGEVSNARKQLIKLADGTRTTAELVKLLGVKKEHIWNSMSYLRRHNYNVDIKYIDNERSEETLNNLLLRNKKGETKTKLAAELGISPTRMGQILFKQERKQRGQK